MSAKEKRLIVNADDLGRTSGINRGVIEAHAQGIVTSASLMINYPATVDAIELTRSHARLGLGLHIVLSGGGAPVSAASEIKSLLDARGRFRNDPRGLLDAVGSEIETEVRAQIKRFRALVGRLPTHLDSHHYVHEQPMVLEALIVMAWETGLPIRSLSPAMALQLRSERVAICDHTEKRFHGDNLTTEWLIRLIGELQPGTSELICHPGLVDDELRLESRYAEPRQRELVALKGDNVRATLQSLGVRLIRYSDLSLS